MDHTLPSSSNPPVVAVENLTMSQHLRGSASAEANSHQSGPRGPNSSQGNLVRLHTVDSSSECSYSDLLEALSSSAAGSTAATAGSQGAAGQQQSTSRPRQRFRKKGNGYFDEGTELRHRISKLMLDTRLVMNKKKGIKVVVRGVDPKKSTISASSRYQDKLPSIEPILEGLKKASVSKKQNKAQSSNQSGQVGSIRKMQDDDFDDSFDSPSFVAAAIRNVGRERFESVRPLLGSSSPSDHEQFLYRLGIGPRRLSSDQMSKTAPAKDVFKIKPSSVMKVDSSDSEKKPKLLFKRSIAPRGTPALLRRRVKRMNHGYRAADVLHARLQDQGPPGLRRESDYLSSGDESSTDTEDSRDEDDQRENNEDDESIGERSEESGSEQQGRRQVSTRARRPDFPRKVPPKKRRVYDPANAIEDHSKEQNSFSTVSLSMAAAAQRRGKNKRPRRAWDAGSDSLENSESDRSFSVEPARKYRSLGGHK